jgi:hypothetical protein
MVALVEQRSILWRILLEESRDELVESRNHKYFEITEGEEIVSHPYSFRTRKVWPRGKSGDHDLPWGHPFDRATILLYFIA